MPHSHDITPTHESAIVWLLLAVGLLCAPTARRDSAQRPPQSVTELSGCLAYRLRREAFAYVRTLNALMAYTLVGATARWLRARHDCRAASYRLSGTTDQRLARARHERSMVRAALRRLPAAPATFRVALGSRAKGPILACVTNGYGPGGPTHTPASGVRGSPGAVTVCNALPSEAAALVSQRILPTSARLLWRIS